VTQNAGNFCRAKAKIPVAAIRKVAVRFACEAEEQARQFDDLSVPIEDDQAEERCTPQVVADVRAKPMTGRFVLVDGFTVDGADTPENQAKYPQNPAQAEGLGFPMMRCVSLISMATGMLIDLAYAAYSGKGTGETSLLRQLRGSLRRGDILVADSYYCTYWLIAMCRKIGVEVVMKNHHKRDDDPIGSRRLSETERMTHWVRPPRPAWMSKKEYQSIPKLLEIRLSDIKADQPNSRSEGFTIATTMLDTETHSREWLGSLYESRWMVETDIQSMKCTIGLEHLRAQSPEGLERDLWTGILTYNLVRLKMLQSGYWSNRELRSMSFTETYQLLSTNWLLCACSGVSDALATSSQEQGVSAMIGNRPGRVEPRANKRRPKVLKLMTVSRRIFKAAIAAISKIP
jgi:hypothetical protein